MQNHPKGEVVCSPRPNGKSFYESPVIFKDPVSGIKQIYFSDLFQSEVLVAPLDGKDCTPEVKLKPDSPCNGLAFHQDGTLFACEIGTIGGSNHRLLSFPYPLTNNPTTLAKQYDKNPLHAPNDLVVTDKGIYFTDPGLALPGSAIHKLNETVAASILSSLVESIIRVFGLKQRDAVYFYPGHLPGKELNLCSENNPISKPNGIAVSPDGTRLYIAESGRFLKKASICVAQLGADGMPGRFHRWKVMNAKNSADGMAVRANGDVYATNGKVIQVISPNGKASDPIVGKSLKCGVDGYSPSNLCFHGSDQLFITYNEGPKRIEWLKGKATAKLVRIDL